MSLENARAQAVSILKTYFQGAGYTPQDQFARQDFSAEMELLVDSIVAATISSLLEALDVEDIRELKVRLHPQEVTGPDEEGQVIIVREEGS